MSSIVVEFESSSPAAEGEEDLQRGYAFIEIIKSLAITQAPPNLHIAEDVFARCAKRRFRNLIDSTEDGVVMQSRDEATIAPAWSSSTSVTLPTMPGKGLKKEEFAERANEYAGMLEDLVVEYAGMVNSLRKQRKIILIDALSCKVREVSLGNYKFEIKQLWSIW